MPKLRHIALATQDPERTATFYKEAFDFKEIGRTGDPSKPDASHGIFLSDGTLNIAILKFGWDQLGKGLDYVGLHHFGVLVDDADAYTEKLQALGADCFAPKPDAARGGGNIFYEVKFRGPDGVVFDITDHAWKGAAPLDS
jgi:catechol 2,3-dioxygenase-like lactoylglutathione lyase family enzyme